MSKASPARTKTFTGSISRIRRIIESARWGAQPTQEQVRSRTKEKRTQQRFREPPQIESCKSTTVESDWLRVESSTAFGVPSSRAKAEGSRFATRSFRSLVLCSFVIQRQSGSDHSSFSLRLSTLNQQPSTAPVVYCHASRRSLARRRVVM